MTTFNLGGVVGALIGGRLLTWYGSKVTMVTMAVGAVVCAGGMAIVSVLALRAMGEWREIADRERAGHAPR